jgi:hypothetical protein
VLQVNLRDLQIHSSVPDCFILGVNQSLRFLGVAGAETFAFVGLGVEAVIRITASAIH